MFKDITEPQYSIGQLAELADVSRRTVHFYVQQEPVSYTHLTLPTNREV